MGEIGPKLRRSKSDVAECISHWCPACEEVHVYTLHNSTGPKWTWNGDAQKPSFTPSMKVSWGKHVNPESKFEGGICHYFLTDGVLSYCGDSTHAFAGKSVELPDFPAHLRD